MAKTILESIDNIRNSFIAISNVASASEDKFKEEGKMYFDANMNSRDNRNLQELPRVCNFFSDTAKKYADTSVLAGIMTDMTSEQDKAMQDYNLFKLEQYTSGRYCENMQPIAVLKNTDYHPQNDLDKKAFVHINDEVRLANSNALNIYKASFMTPNPKVVVPHISREEKVDTAIKKLMNKKKPKELQEIQKYEMPIKEEIKPCKEKDALLDGYEIGKMIGRILGVIIAVGLIIAGFIVRSGEWGAIAAIAGIALIIGAICFFGVAFILSLVIDSIFGLIRSITKSHKEANNRKKANKIKKLNENRIKVRDKKYKDLYNYIAVNYSLEIESQVAEWEAEDRKRQAESDARVDKSNEWYNKYAYDERGNKITKQTAQEIYYREIARIAATSAPIITTLMEAVNMIEEHLGIITKEYEDIVKLSGAKNISRDALSCYYMIHNGEVSTYEQAIQMKKNLDEANTARENYQREQERKRLEEEKKHREWLEQYRKQEAERAEKERIEYQRKMDELDRRAAERNRTIAIAAGALAISQSINEHNEALEKIAKQLEQ